MTWKKVEYKNGKGFRWVRVKPSLDLSEFDETTLNKPKSLTADIVFKNGSYELLHHETRQYRKGIAKTCLAFNGINGRCFQIIDKQIAQITIKEKAMFLDKAVKLGLFDKAEKLKVDSRNMGLAKYGFNVVLGKKRHVEIERLFGYKSKTIHQLPRNTNPNLVFDIHIKYLTKIFKIQIQ